MTSSVCIIPARSGSKRIANKNIIDFRGKPLLVWTIEAAQKSEKFDRIIVSTDSEDIKKIATNNGALVPKLRTKYSDDHSPVSLATLSSLVDAENVLAERFDVVTQLMPNCPFRNHHTIRKFQEAFLTNNYDSLLSCADFGWHKPWWAFELEASNNAKFLFPEMLKQRSQDLKTLYSVSGAIWSIRSSLLKKHNTFYLENASFYPIDRIQAVDIDTFEDLNFAVNLVDSIPAES